MVDKKKTPKKPKKSSQNAKSEDGSVLWAGVTGDVRPLTQGKNRVLDHDEDFVAQNKTKKGTLPGKPSKRPRIYTELPIPSKNATPAPGEISHGLAAGVDKRTNMRLIKGQMPVEATLDLHGHTRESGHRALDAFIDAAWDGNKRCVQVITGKGLNIQSGEIGVLRKSVPDWLNSARLRPKILAFSFAPRRDGGEGALNILLRRKR
jgi:DNA-nicking Smr family endonuclease